MALTLFAGLLSLYLDHQPYQDTLHDPRFEGLSIFKLVITYIVYACIRSFTDIRIDAGMFISV